MLAHIISSLIEAKQRKKILQHKICARSNIAHKAKNFVRSLPFSLFRLAPLSTRASRTRNQRSQRDSFLSFASANLGVARYERFVSSLNWQLCGVKMLCCFSQFSTNKAPHIILQSFRQFILNLFFLLFFTKCKFSTLLVCALVHR